MFWRNKKVLVTGHTGFKGGWLSLWLQSMGAELIGLALDPPTKQNIYEQANVAEGMVSLRADIRDLDSLKEIFYKHKPDIVFHLAAQPLVRYSYLEPVETYETNVMGTLNVLEAIRYIDSVRAAVIITTDKCYENQEWEWGYRENEPMGGHDPYSSSKGCTELLVASYRKSYFPVQSFSEHKTAIASARAGNVIGGGDWAEDRLIPDIVRAINHNDDIKIRNPHSIRPWQHVLAPLAGYLKLAERMCERGSEFSEAWNFGPSEDDAKHVEWVVEYMINKWGANSAWSVDGEPTLHEATYLKLDSSKARGKLPWLPTWDLKSALDKVIEWHKAEKIGGDMRAVSLQQINDYIESGKS